MFERIRNHFYDRRKGFFIAAGVTGSIYMVGSYVADRLEEMREQAAQLQKTRENLRRRFQQNQEDVQFTVMTHLPTLGNAILSGMDVESVTRELQARSRLARVRAHSPDTQTSESSLVSSVELGREPDTAGVPSRRAEMSTDTASSVLGESMLSNVSSNQTQSWVEEFNSQLVGSSAGPSLAIPSPPIEQREPTLTLSSSQSNIGTDMSASMVSESLPSTSASVSEKSHSLTTQSEHSEPELSPLSSKTKAELWYEVKMLTFTRILTIIYSTTLLTLLTTMQLNIIGRSKYVQSVVQLHREEKLREHSAFKESVSSLFFGGPPVSNLDQWLDEDIQGINLITPETERKVLTLSWWLLYVGWKDVSERVRRSVEEVFDGVSLKSRLGPMELQRLVCDVRRRVEHEFTYEGTERRINFLSTIIPPSPETLALVFGEGGVPDYRASQSTNTVSSSNAPHYFASTSQSHQHYPDPESDLGFARLLKELRETATSPAFAHVLELSLDRATDGLFDGLRKNSFGGLDTDMDTEAEKPRLANLLPDLARLAHLALNAVPNELVDSTTELKEMTAFAAIIYSSYDGHFR